MTERSVLAAAVALRDFSSAQLAAHCGIEPAEVEEVLTGAPGLVPAGPARWRVDDAGVVRSRLRGPGGSASGSTGDRSGPTSRTELVSFASSLVLLAEEALIGCSEVESGELRRVRAETAANQLRRGLAMLSPTPDPWWRIDAERAIRAVQAGSDPRERALAPRVRADLGLATITEHEALGAPVGLDLLGATAGDLRGLAGTIDSARVKRLLCRLADLAARTPSVETRDGLGGKPARMVRAVGWMRAREQTLDADLLHASATVERLPHQFSGWFAQLRARPSTALCRVVADLPDGRQRLQVFSDLVRLLPRDLTVAEQREVVDGVVVEAVADPGTSRWLQTSASRLERGLEEMPYASDRALVGHLAHVMPQLAGTPVEGSAPPEPGRVEAATRDVNALLGTPR